MARGSGVDALHVSTGSPSRTRSTRPGFRPRGSLAKTYDTMLSSGRYAFRNYLLLRTWPLNIFFRLRWNKPRPRHRRRPGR